jgi:hypothetical protein
MEYLFQFKVTAEKSTCPEPIDYEIDGIKYILYLHPKDIFTNTKKLHVIVTAETVEAALNLVYKYFSRFQDRLMFFTGREILIGTLK